MEATINPQKYPSQTSFYLVDPTTGPMIVLPSGMFPESFLRLIHPPESPFNSHCFKRIFSSFRILLFQQKIRADTGVRPCVTTIDFQKINFARQQGVNRPF
jgi:hypothetical protein